MNCYFLIVFFGNKNQNRSIIHLEASVFSLHRSKFDLLQVPRKSAEEGPHTKFSLMDTMIFDF